MKYTCSPNTPVTHTLVCTPRTKRDCHGRSLAMDQYKVMCHQEELKDYKCMDYLDLAETIARCQIWTSPSGPIDLKCRVRMVEWCFRLVDSTGFNREVVYVAMSFLDRFLSCRSSPASIKVISCRKKYQLATLAALSLAIKMNHNTICAKTLSDLSRGGHSATQILSMENTILMTLGWRTNGPTTYDFLNYVISLVAENGQQHSIFASSEFKELCHFQLDSSVGDYFFCFERPSIIAIAAILNAAESSSNLMSRTAQRTFVHELRQFCDVDLLSGEMQTVASRLRLLLKNNGVSLPQLASKKTTISNQWQMDSFSSRTTC